MKNTGVCLLVFLTLSLQTCLAMTTISSPPTIVKQPLQEQLFQVSQSQDEQVKPFTLDCEANGNPEPTYRWKKNGENFDLESENGRITKHPQKGTLYFNQPQDSDEAIYQCFAANIHGIALSTTVSVRKAELNTFPDEEPKEVIVKEGEPLSLKCIPPSGYPKPTIFWIIQSNTGVLHSINSSRISVDPNGDLHFTNVTEADALEDAHYTCKATSMFRNEYKLGNKIVLRVDRASNPSLNKRPPIQQYVSPPNIVAVRGQKLELSCMYGGTPAPSIIWSKKNGNLHSGPVTYTNYGKTLKIRRVNFKDQGTYECMASNGVGDPATYSIEVTVTAVPYWIHAPNNTNRAEEEAVSYKCIAGGMPIPEVKWYVNGVPLEDVKPNPRRKLDTSENVLAISELKKSDTGVFQCNASNDYGYVFQNFYLNILAVAPTIEESLAPVISVVASSVVVLKCRVFGVPNPKIRWLKDSEVVKGGRFQVLDSGDLKIKNVNSEDEGEYTCDAVNKFGNISASGMLEVKNTPNPPHILGVECDELTAMVMWEPTGDRRAPIQSYTVQYNTSFTPNKWEDAVADIPASDTKFKVSLTPWVNYTFRVIAHNKIGPSEPSGHTEVCKTPEDVPHKNPDNVMGKGTAKDNLVIKWTAMPMIEHNAPGFFYKIFWKREDIPQATWQSVENRLWKKNSYIVPHQPTFKPYRIKVEAHNSLGQAFTAATEVIGYSGEDIPLEDPKNFKLLYIKDSRSAMFSWDPVPPDSVRGHFRGYKIQTWTPDEGENRLREQVVNANVSQSLVTIFRPFQHNLVRVLVFSDSYKGPPSPVLEFIPPEDIPGPVAYFDAIPLGSTSLYLIWKRPIEPNGLLTGYNIYYREVIGTELGVERERLPPITDPTETRAKLVGLKPKTKYRVDIYATTSKGQGEKMYIEVQTNNQTEHQPDEPYFVWSHLPEEDGKTGVRVTWVPAVEGYPGSHFFVQYKKSGDNTWQSSQLEENQDSTLIEGMEIGGLYKMRVVAVDGPFQTSSKVAEFYTGKIDEVGEVGEPELTFAPAWLVGMLFAIGVLIILVMIIFAVKRNRLSAILFPIPGAPIQDI